MKSAIAYYRVSTQRQGRSGLGIAAQRATVARFAEAERMALTAEYTEVETGKGADGSRLPSKPPGKQSALSSSPSSIACRAMWRSSPV